jgi:lysophospholipase L1-like esterase
VNLGDARVREGLSLTERILGRIRKRLTAHDAWLLVVLLPSKELSFAKAEAADGTPLGPIYTKAANMETEILRRLRSDLKARGIASVDLLPAFQTAIAERRPVFPTDGDTHPTPEGYRLIASRVAEEIAALGW